MLIINSFKLVMFRTVRVNSEGPLSSSILPLRFSCFLLSSGWDFQQELSFSASYIIWPIIWMLGANFYLFTSWKKIRPCLYFYGFYKDEVVHIFIVFIYYNKLQSIIKNIKGMFHTICVLSTLYSSSSVRQRGNSISSVANFHRRRLLLSIG